MNSEESNPVQSQEIGLELPPSVLVETQRKRHRWWLWLFVLCLLGVAVYALLFYTGQAAPLEEWRAHLTRLGVAAYDLLPGRAQDAAQSSKPAETPGTANKSAAPPAPPGASSKPAETPAVRAVPVVAMTARQGNMGVYLSGLGSVAAFNTVTVRARVDGQLVKVAYQEGQFVRKGDLLAEIDARPFQVQLEQAEGQMARDQAQLKNAKIDLERYKVLLAQDSVAKQQLDTQISTVTQYEGVIKSDQAQIDTAKLLLTYSRITAPISGRIGLRLVDEGNMVRATDQNSLAVITQVQPIALLFNLPADDLPQVLKRMHTGQPLTVEAYNRDLKQKLATGTLLTLDNQIDPTTGTVRCKAVFPNEDNALFPNQFVNARLLVDTKRDMTIVPAAAIQRSSQMTYVFVVKDDSTVEMRTVTLGPTEGEEVAIENGLSPGEVVVTEGVDKVQRGTKVAARTTPADNTRKSK